MLVNIKLKYMQFLNYRYFSIQYDILLLQFPFAYLVLLTFKYPVHLSQNYFEGTSRGRDLETRICTKTRRNKSRQIFSESHAVKRRPAG